MIDPKDWHLITIGEVSASIVSLLLIYRAASIHGNNISTRRDTSLVFIEMAKIPKSYQSRNTSRNYVQRHKWSNTNSGQTGSGIRCLEGVSISCLPVTSAVSPVSRSLMRSYWSSKSVCQERLNYWYEKIRQHLVQWKFVIVVELGGVIIPCRPVTPPWTLFPDQLNRAIPSKNQCVSGQLRVGTCIIHKTAFDLICLSVKIFWKSSFQEPHNQRNWNLHGSFRT
jgi:hypothetical protein